VVVWLSGHGRHRYLGLGPLQQHVQLGYIAAMGFLLRLKQLILAAQLVFQKLILFANTGDQLLIGRRHSGHVVADRRLRYDSIRRFGWGG
jgi:hypothetical protein